MKTRPPRALIVHGGAWDIPDDAVTAHREGVLAAVRAGGSVLDSDGGAMDAVEAAIRRMEDDPTFDAGVGSMLNREGHVELLGDALRQIRVGVSRDECHLADVLRAVFVVRHAHS